MVGREVQGLEYVIVVLNLGTLRYVVAEFAENVHNLLTHNGYRMAGPQRQGVAGHRQVLFGEGRYHRFLRGGLELLDAGRCRFFEFVQALAILAFELRRHRAEFVHEGGNFALLAQKTDTGFFHFLGGGRFELFQLFENLFNRFFHAYFFFLVFLLFLLSLASWARLPPLFQYLAHCSGVKKRL